MFRLRSWSLIFCAASSCAIRERCSSCACTTSALAFARAADSRRRASATSESTARMFSELKDSPEIEQFTRTGVLDNNREFVVVFLLRADNRALLNRRQCAAVRNAGTGIEELIVLEQVDGAASGGGKHVGQDAELLFRGLREKLVRGGLHHRFGFSHRDDCRRLHGHFDRVRLAVRIEVGGLVGDVDVDVDRRRRDHVTDREQRNDPRFSRAPIDTNTAVRPTDETNFARFHVAIKRIDDEREHDEQPQQSA